MTDKERLEQVKRDVQEQPADTPEQALHKLVELDNITYYERNWEV